MTNSKVPVRDGTCVLPPGAPQEPPCNCFPPDTTVVEVVNGQGGGVRDYEMLSNKPSIENVVLVGNRELEEFGFGTASAYDVHQLFRQGA